MPSEYQSAINKLLSLADFERKSRQNSPPDFHLKRTALLMDALDNPHLKVPVIHVAGTKGKGSTCAMITSALDACGYRTGLFTSPHLHRMTERFRVNMRPVDENTFVDLFTRIWPIASEIGTRGDAGLVSVFEFQTAMAFLHFAEIKADVAVIEVGLGGRLDSTNVVMPELSVITPIGLDHTSVLGETIRQIAAEKAGIIKPGVPVVSAGQPPEAMEVIQSTASRLDSPLTLASSVREVTAAVRSLSGQKLDFAGEMGRYRIDLPLLGDHQAANARTAIAALETFSMSGRRLDAGAVERGLSTVCWPGRVQVLEPGPPALVADGAHNHDSAVALRRALAQHCLLSERPVVLLGATGGHDPLAVARAFRDLSPRIIVTASRHPKAVGPSSFASALEADRIPVTGVTSNTRVGLRLAREAAAGTGLIVAAGSLFVAAEVIELVRGMEPELYPDMTGAAGPVSLRPTTQVAAP
jgi:dihydrofolate synthase/folylpolyglutamate synthase